ncbi:hypothetical protein G6F64_008163 [Rhizopus arrhizus]|uniref:THUMP domain-containing protein n=1 Tax=Rhizopus oryzae TaxID=64495 RepID=A0A9P7BPV8_RHIOR|nr:hypothetical protein G6F64_008163 [Rhizopus arrhizus]
MSNKRGAPQGGNRKKRNKTYHCAKEASGSKGKNAFNLLPGMKGVLVACTRGRESRAVKEALEVLNEYADTLYPNSKEQEAEDEEEDIEASIAKEVAEMKGSKEKKRFANITTGTDCLAFIRATDPVEPVELIHYMLTDLNEKQLKKTRYISRYLPIQKTCQSNLSDIENVGKELFPPYFDQKDNEGNLLTKKFAIVCRVRNCNKLSTKDVINLLAATVPKGHKVDLENPDYTIIVEVCQVSITTTTTTAIQTNSTMTTPTPESSLSSVASDMTTTVPEPSSTMSDRITTSQNTATVHNSITMTDRTVTTEPYPTLSGERTFKSSEIITTSAIPTVTVTSFGTFVYTHTFTSYTLSPITSPVLAHQPSPPFTHTFNSGAIAGGVVGGVAFVSLIGIIGYFIFKKRKPKTNELDLPQQIPPMRPLVPAYDSRHVPDQRHVPHER